MSAGNERHESAFLKDALAGTRFSKVEWLSETGSTNDDLLARARQGAPEQVLITDLQTAGRGRRGRIWDAPARSSILMSTLLRGRSPEDGFWAVGALALAASQAVDAIVTSRCSLKWPNDVMLGDQADQKKVAGVLAQVADDVVIVGIGINVNWPNEVPPALAERGTAVNRHTSGDVEVDRAALTVDILRRAIGHLDADAAELRAAWRMQCATIGQHVRIDREPDAIVGNAVDIGPDGALVIENDVGRTVHYMGDVVHLRPA